MPDGYDIIVNDLIDKNPKHKFIRIHPTDVKATLRAVFTSLSSMSWIDAFDADYMRNSFRQRAERTITHIATKIITGDNDNITENSGEYVVSELARKTIVDTFDYLDIPLAELFKKQKSGNPGYDFYTETPIHIILFGEAKYKSDRNAYAQALQQLNDFEQDQADIEDLIELKEFCSDEGLNNANNGRKGYIAAFSTKLTRTETLIHHIKQNDDFKALSRFDELICVAIDL